MTDRLQNISRAVLWPTYLDPHNLHSGRRELLLLGNKHFFLIAEAMHKVPYPCQIRFYHCTSLLPSPVSQSKITGWFLNPGQRQSPHFRLLRRLLFASTTMQPFSAHLSKTLPQSDLLRHLLSPPGGGAAPMAESCGKGTPFRMSNTGK